MQRLEVVVWSCGGLGIEVANRLEALSSVGRVTLIQAPWRAHCPPQGFAARLRHLVRMQGPWAPLDVLATRLGLTARALASSTATPEPEPVLREGISRIYAADFHDDEALTPLHTADLGVVAGTYVLRESIFAMPKLGSINLHSGKAPEYRGAAPAFWELYNGEREVGITIHRVARKLDSGKILLQECFPLDPAPSGDPFNYVERYRREVLRPNGVRMLAQATEAIAHGNTTEIVQDHTRAHTYRTPDYRAKMELHQRVVNRRSGPA